MKNVFAAIMVFTIYMLLSIFATGLVYIGVFGLMLQLAMYLNLPHSLSWSPLAGTFLVFLIGVVTAIQKRIPEITNLKWDSGTTQDCPSKVYVPDGGGYLWNMNPLGPNSARSIVTLGGAILCFGPALAVAAFTNAVETLKDSANKTHKGIGEDLAKPSE
jgi:hypothetical protein